ncbi:serine/threonine-protein kinase [Allorhodopirellula heiligendammensis]|uniref:Serine/threonine-protein kinase StkP n=1 Tax=Allorhodopirellula heiligendammensis TaxID=2714739 RepID=A0A5C6C0M2_9BACT|nr:serine/threonine-protein kinase [Allorhodopirellula heiligendammensis]TWU16704.1 Serine/threonine-protein kinase StkP [Allorhodopirellula heiligendammensis]
MQKTTSVSTATAALPPLRVKGRLGKYRLDRRIGQGGFADVYAATDTLLSIKVALKIPNAQWVSDELIAAFRREAKMTMGFEHPHILPIRDASFIDGRFIIVTPLASRTLDDRLKNRMSFETAFEFTSQLLDAVAYAHQHGVIHCDIKPENVMLFEDDWLRLGDFGIAKVAQKTISGSGTGTLGYMAPEQAMGKPSKRSDVFSLGLVAYRMLSGKWPEYPFEWPFPGATAMRRRVHADVVAIIRKSVAIRPRDRFVDAEKMAAAWEKSRLKASRFAKRSRKTA